MSGDTWFDFWGFGGSFKIKELWGGGVTWFDTFQAKMVGFAGSANSGGRKLFNKIKVGRLSVWASLPTPHDLGTGRVPVQERTIALNCCCPG